MVRNYKKPTMVVESFTPSEYMAMCGDVEQKYYFKCDANSNGWFGDGGLVYEETNGTPGLQTYTNVITGVRADKMRSAYSPCSATHEASTGDEFISGYLWAPGGQVEDVMIWTDNGTNTHCTKKLSWENIETNKS